MKPVSIPQITKALASVKEKLDEETDAKGPALLSALFCGAEYDEGLLERLYGGGKYHFALVRWGNLRIVPILLANTAPIPLNDTPFLPSMAAMTTNRYSSCPRACPPASSSRP